MEDRRAGFAIGSATWPGIGKLIEEFGEALQVAGKLIGRGGEGDHWDGTELGGRLEEELGDVLAAVEFVIQHNALSRERIARQAETKLGRFEDWHDAQGVVEE